LPTFAAVNADIDREGPKVVLWERLFANARGAAFEPFLQKVESGDRAWINVAVRLRAASDAGVSLMLEQALTMALPKSPALVLESLTQGEDVSQFSLQVICSGDTFLKDEPRGRVLAWYKQSEHALAKLTQPSLKAKRDECLRSLRAGRKAFSARKTESK
jgi:hypothetical protein